MRHHRSLSALLLFVLASVAGPIWAQEGAKDAMPNGSPPGGLANYRIGPEDVLKISVWNNEALSPTVHVRPDGKISLPLLNDIQASGLTTEELRDVIAKGLVGYVVNPEVSVIVTEIKSFKVSVIGEVVRPGRHELKSRTTVLDAIALSGGFTPFAARSRVVVLRPDGNVMKRIPFNYAKLSGGLLDRILSFGGEEQDNFYLEGGDIVLVP